MPNLRTRVAVPLALAATLLLAFVIPAGAVSSRVWKQREKADFDQGDPDLLATH